MAFSNAQFPKRIAYGSQGGPRHSNAITELNSGQRKVSTRWDGALRRWDAKFGIKKQTDLYEVYNFVLAHNGAQHTFRFWDPLDFTSNTTDGSDSNITSTDQVIGIGNGTRQSFQLTKTYQVGSLTQSRRIILPSTSPAPLVSVNGVLKTEGSDYTIDYLSGEVLFAVAPAIGAVIRAGFMFDCHAQFSSDVDKLLSFSLTGFKAGEVPSITIEEVIDDASNSTDRPFGGSARFSFSSDKRLSLNTGSLIMATPTIATLALWLPNPKGLGSGMLYYHIVNESATHDFDLRDHTANVVGTIVASSKAFISLCLNGDNTKSWVVT